MLENKINELLDEADELMQKAMLGHLYVYLPRSNFTVACWKWDGKPRSKNYDLCDNRTDKAMYEEIDWLIREAPKATCETSPSEYIRECKRWFNVKGS